jgi:hypothetical protein
VPGVAYRLASDALQIPWKNKRQHSRDTSRSNISTFAVNHVFVNLDVSKWRDAGGSVD